MDRLLAIFDKLEPFILAVKIIALFGIGIYSLWLAILIMGSVGLIWATTFLLFVLAVTITTIIDVVFRLIGIARRKIND